MSVFDRIQYPTTVRERKRQSKQLRSEVVIPKVIEHLLPSKGKREVEFNFEKGVSSLRITMNDEENRPTQRIVKPKVDVKKGNQFLNKYVPKK